MAANFNEVEYAYATSAHRGPSRIRNSIKEADQHRNWHGGLTIKPGTRRSKGRNIQSPQRQLRLLYGTQFVNSDDKRKRVNGRSCYPAREAFKSCRITECYSNEYLSDFHRTSNVFKRVVPVINNSQKNVDEAFDNYSKSLSILASVTIPKSTAKIVGRSKHRINVQTDSNEYVFWNNSNEKRSFKHNVGEYRNSVLSNPMPTSSRDVSLKRNRLHREQKTVKRTFDSDLMSRKPIYFCDKVHKNSTKGRKSKKNPRRRPGRHLRSSVDASLQSHGVRHSRFDNEWQQSKTEYEQVEDLSGIKVMNPISHNHIWKENKVFLQNDTTPCRRRMKERVMLIEGTPEFHKHNLLCKRVFLNENEISRMSGSHRRRNKEDRRQISTAFDEDDAKHYKDYQTEYWKTDQPRSSNELTKSEPYMKTSHEKDPFPENDEVISFGRSLSPSASEAGSSVSSTLSELSLITTDHNQTFENDDAETKLAISSQKLLKSERVQYNDGKKLAQNCSGNHRRNTIKNPNGNNQCNTTRFLGINDKSMDLTANHQGVEEVKTFKINADSWNENSEESNVQDQIFIESSELHNEIELQTKSFDKPDNKSCGDLEDNIHSLRRSLGRVLGEDELSLVSSVTTLSSVECLFKGDNENDNNTEIKLGEYYYICDIRSRDQTKESSSPCHRSYPFDDVKISETRNIVPERIDDSKQTLSRIKLSQLPSYENASCSMVSIHGDYKEELEGRMFDMSEGESRTAGTTCTDSKLFFQDKHCNRIRGSSFVFFNCYPVDFKEEINASSSCRAREKEVVSTEAGDWISDISENKH